MNKWEHFSHEADIGIRGFGDTLQEAFHQAALAMTSIITELENVEARDAVSVQCQADDNDILFLDWINEIIYQMATRHMLFSEFVVEINNGSLHATLKGEPIDRQKHQPTVEIKGATLTELQVKQQDDYWVAQTVVDV